MINLEAVYESLAYHTPPEDQGQTVEYSYAIDTELECIVERCIDRSDKSVSYTAYEYGEGEFQPWHSAPSLGDRI